MAKEKEGYSNTYEILNILLYIPVIFFTIIIININGKFEEISIQTGISHLSLLIIYSLLIALCLILLFAAIPKQIKQNKYSYLLIAFCSIVFWLSIFYATVKDDSNLIVGGATFVLVLVTGYNVYQTQLNAQIAHQNQNEPRPIIEIDDSQLNEGILSITIENYGNGLTRDIRFDISPPDIQTVNEEIIVELYNIKNGIQYLAPRQRITLARIYGMDFICYLERKYEGLNREELIQKAKENEILEIQLFYYTDDLSKRTALFKFDLLTYWGPMIPI